MLGIDPDKRLLERSRSWSDLRLAMEEGRGPVKELYDRESDWRRESDEREEGILPWNEF